MQRRGSFLKRRGGVMYAHRRPIYHDRVNVMCICHSRHDPLPDPCIAPVIEAVIDRCIGAVLIGQIALRDASSKDIEDAVDDAPVVDPLHPTAIMGENRFDELPLQIAQV